MNYYAVQSFEGLTVQRLKNDSDTKFFLGGSSAGRVYYKQNRYWLRSTDVTHQLGETTIQRPLDHSAFIRSRHEVGLSFTNGRIYAIEKNIHVVESPDRFKVKLKPVNYDRPTHCVYSTQYGEYKITCDYRKYKEVTAKKMSTHTKQKIRNKLQAFYYVSGCSLNFVTLTFVAKVDDLQAKKILNTFLTQIRKTYADFSYLWVAEKQANGNIHYHLVTNKFLDVTRFNQLWVRCQFNAGVNFHGINKWSTYRKALTAGKIKGLNPFDVKKVRDLSACAAYVSEYITKNETEMETSLWHCSRCVSILGTSTYATKKDFLNHLDAQKNYSVNKSTGEIFDVDRMRVDSEGKLRHSYQHWNEHFLYIKTLNKKMFHNSIERYITGINKKIYKKFVQIQDLRQEIALTKRLSGKRRELIARATADEYIHQCRNQIAHLKLSVYKVIPIIKTFDLIITKGFSWN